MHPLEQQERFEMEVLVLLNNKRILDSLIFGGGTMLRLCYGMNRFSADMDFYFKKRVDFDRYLERLEEVIGTRYGITDSQNKFKTILVELRHAQYPRRLKLEINKERVYPNFKQTIAFSPHSNHQVFVNVVTLDQMMTNKLEALLNRKEIRDAYDINFLLKRGVEFPPDKKTAKASLSVIKKFSNNEFNVKLGSLLPIDERNFYRQNRFGYLEDHLNQVISGSLS